MRVDIQSQSVTNVPSSNADKNANKDITPEITSAHEEVKAISKEKLNQVVDSINSVIETNNNELKFVFHDDLEEYFVQLVDSETEEVVKEIPPKKLLDAFYEMQKLVGLIVDEKI